STVVPGLRGAGRLLDVPRHRRDAGDRLSSGRFRRGRTCLAAASRGRHRSARAPGRALYARAWTRRPGRSEGWSAPAGAVRRRGVRGGGDRGPIASRGCAGRDEGCDRIRAHGAARARRRAARAAWTVSARCGRARPGVAKRPRSAAAPSRSGVRSTGLMDWRARGRCRDRVARKRPAGSLGCRRDACRRRRGGARARHGRPGPVPSRERHAGARGGSRSRGSRGGAYDARRTPRDRSRAWRERYGRDRDDRAIGGAAPRAGAMALAIAGAAPGRERDRGRSRIAPRETEAPARRESLRRHGLELAGGAGGSDRTGGAGPALVSDRERTDRELLEHGRVSRVGRAICGRRDAGGSRGRSGAHATRVAARPRNDRGREARIIARGPPLARMARACDARDPARRNSRRQGRRGLVERALRGRRDGAPDDHAARRRSERARRLEAGSLDAGRAGRAAGRCIRRSRDCGLDLDRPGASRGRPRMKSEGSRTPRFGRNDEEKSMRYADRMSQLGTETAFEVLAKARALEAKGRTIVHLEIGEPDFDTPASIRQAAIRAIEEGFTHYGPSAGLPEVREAIAQYVTKDRGLPVAPEQVVVTPGGKPVLTFSVLACVN